MRVKLQLVMCSDDGQEETITDIVTLQKDSQRIEHLGLTLREAKQLLNTIQQRLLRHQVDCFSTHAQAARPAVPPSKPKAIIPAYMDPPGIARTMSCESSQESRLHAYIRPVR